MPPFFYHWSFLFPIRIARRIRKIDARPPPPIFLCDFVIPARLDARARLGCFRSMSDCRLDKEDASLGKLVERG